MLKRAWLFLSVLWTAICVYFLAISPTMAHRDFYLLISIPWIGGILVILFWRYVQHGSFARRFRRY